MAVEWTGRLSARTHCRRAGGAGVREKRRPGPRPGRGLGAVRDKRSREAILDMGRSPPHMVNRASLQISLRAWKVESRLFSFGMPVSVVYKGRCCRLPAWLETELVSNKVALLTERGWLCLANPGYSYPPAALPGGIGPLPGPARQHAFGTQRIERTHAAPLPAPDALLDEDDAASAAGAPFLASPASRPNRSHPRVSLTARSWE